MRQLELPLVLQVAHLCVVTQRSSPVKSVAWPQKERLCSRLELVVLQTNQLTQSKMNQRLPIFLQTSLQQHGQFKGWSLSLWNFASFLKNFSVNVTLASAPVPYPPTPFWNFWVYCLAVHTQANVSSDKQHIFEEQCGLEERVWVTWVTWVASFGSAG